MHGTCMQRTRASCETEESAASSGRECCSLSRCGSRRSSAGAGAAACSAAADGAEYSASDCSAASWSLAFGPLFRQLTHLRAPWHLA